jgi:tRNA dimethylallyltransferase
MVGGSGLYVDAVLKGFDFQKLIPKYENKSRKITNFRHRIFAVKKLEELDSLYFKTLTQENPNTSKSTTNDAFFRSLYRNRKTVFFL